LAGSLRSVIHHLAIARGHNGCHCGMVAGSRWSGGTGHAAAPSP
jgi:hypothetical protein